MNPAHLELLSQALLSGIFLGSTTVKAWYLLPLIVSISLVYGGTRHESLPQILAHSVRTAVWLIVFLSVIFVIVWLSGFGVASDLLNVWDSQILLAAMAWVFGAMWISGAVFQANTMAGLGCLLTGGILALAIGLKSFLQRGTFDKSEKNEAGVVRSSEPSMLFPVVLMIGSLAWALFAMWMRN